MPIETRCAGCGKIVRIDDKYAGARARCTNCRTEFTVPPQSDVEALDSVCHYCGAAIPLGEQGEAEFKACSECRESIDENLREIEEQRRQRSILGAGLPRLYVWLFAAVVMIITIVLSIESMFH